MRQASREIRERLPRTPWLLESGPAGLRRWTSLAVLGTLAMALAAGCDGGPDFGTNVDVTNDCGVDIAVGFESVASPAPARSTTKEASRLRAEETKQWLLDPITGSWSGIEYMWVALPGASTWGQPTRVDLRDLPESEGSGGTPERLLVIEGDMCP
jgi:hypothetical protein